MPWTSKTVEGAAPTPMKNPPLLMVRSESRSMVLTISSKSRLCDDLASAQDKVPEPLVLRNWFDEPSELGKV